MFLDDILSAIAVVVLMECCVICADFFLLYIFQPPVKGTQEVNIAFYECLVIFLLKIATKKRRDAVFDSSSLFARGS